MVAVPLDLNGRWRLRKAPESPTSGSSSPTSRSTTLECAKCGRVIYGVAFRRASGEPLHMGCLEFLPQAESEQLRREDTGEVVQLRHCHGTGAVWTVGGDIRVQGMLKGETLHAHLGRLPADYEVCVRRSGRGLGSLLELHWPNGTTWVRDGDGEATCESGRACSLWRSLQILCGRAMLLRRLGDVLFFALLWVAFVYVLFLFQWLLLSLCVRLRGISLSEFAADAVHEQALRRDVTALCDAKHAMFTGYWLLFLCMFAGDGDPFLYAFVLWLVCDPPTPKKTHWRPGNGTANANQTFGLLFALDQPGFCTKYHYHESDKVWWLQVAAIVAMLLTRWGLAFRAWRRSKWSPELNGLSPVDAAVAEGVRSDFLEHCGRYWSALELEVRQVYAVTPVEALRRRFEARARDLGARREDGTLKTLYHGTCGRAVEGIARSGFRLPGRCRRPLMYGNGVYFAAQPQKCWPYAGPCYCATAGGGEKRLLVVSDVAVGRVFEARQAGTHLDQSQLERERSAGGGSYQSVLGLDREQGGVLSMQEYCVYSPEQALPKFVVVVAEPERHAEAGERSELLQLLDTLHWPWSRPASAALLRRWPRLQRLRAWCCAPRPRPPAATPLLQAVG